MNLLQDIEAYLATHKIGPHRFGIKAAGNGRLVERLREGRDITTRTAERVRNFLASGHTSNDAPGLRQELGTTDQM